MNGCARISVALPKDMVIVHRAGGRAILTAAIERPLAARIPKRYENDG